MSTPAKGRADHWDPGDFNAVCSMCGRKRKASSMSRNWQGLYRCLWHDEARQPQDFARGLPDNISVPWAQPPITTFVAICSLNRQCAIPGRGYPGCMVPGNTRFDPFGV